MIFILYFDLAVFIYKKIHIKKWWGDQFLDFFHFFVVKRLALNKWK